MLKLFRKSGLSARDLVVSGAALIIVLTMMTVALSLEWYPTDLWRYVLVAVVTAVVWPVSRVLPATTLILVAAFVAAPSIWGYNDLEIRMVPLAVAGFRAASAGSRAYVVLPVTAIAAAIALVPEAPLMFAPGNTLSRTFIAEWITDPSRRLMVALVLAVILALGFAISRWRTVANDLALRNEQLLALRHAESERVATEVRTAIARDIHDVVAHHVAAMVVRAQAADSVADREPERLREAVQAIAAEGNDALTAMRRAVRVMRTDGRGALDSPASVHSAVDAMTGRLRDVGRRVSVDGDISGAGEDVTLTAMWILRESLTNVMLHSDSRDVRVRLSRSPDSVGVLVEDDGPASTSSGLSSGGNGIPGMRERADTLGGTVSTGPRPGGGWSVRVVLPLTPRGAL